MFQKLQMLEKEIQILFSAFLVNLTVFFDILIILLFSSFFTKKENSYWFLDIFFENLWVLPIIIFCINLFRKIKYFSTSARNK